MVSYTIRYNIKLTFYSFINIDIISLKQKIGDILFLYNMEMRYGKL